MLGRFRPIKGSGVRMVYSSSLGEEQLKNSIEKKYKKRYRIDTILDALRKKVLFA